MKHAPENPVIAYELVADMGEDGTKTIYSSDEFSMILYVVRQLNSFYKSALKFFNKERKIAKGKYFIELVFCLEVEYKKENKVSFTRTEEKTFADNYCDRKEQEGI